MFKNSAIIFSANVLGSGMLALRSYLLANLLGPAGFGLLSMALFFADLSKYADAGFLALAERRFSKQVALDPKRKVKKFFSASLLNVLASFLIAPILIAVVWQSVSSVELKHAVVLAILIYPILVLTKTVIVLNSVNLSFFALGLSFVFVPVLSVVFLFFSQGSTTVNHYLLMLIYANGIFLICLLFVSRKILIGNLRAIFNRYRMLLIKRYFFSGIVFSGLTMLLGVSIFLMRWLTESQFGLAALGNFAMAMTIVTIIDSSMRQASRPLVILIRQEIAKERASIFQYISLPILVRVLFCIAIIAFFFSPIWPMLLKFLFPQMEFLSSLTRILVWVLPISIIGEVCNSVLDSYTVMRLKPIYLAICSTILIYIIVYGFLASSLVQIAFGYIGAEIISLVIRVFAIFQYRKSLS